MNAAPSSPDFFRQSIDLTTRTIDRRSFHFRNTIIATVAIAVAAVVVSLVMRSWRPLTALFLLPSAAGYFIITDTVIIGTWRKVMTGFWAKGEVDFNFFVQTVGMMKTLPKATIEGMLRLLPHRCSYIVKEQYELRSAVAETDRTIMAVQTIRTINGVVTSLIVSVLLGTALLTLSYEALLGNLVLLPFLAVTFPIERGVWRRWRKRIASRLNHRTIDRDDFLKAASLLTWEVKGEKLKSAQLNSFGPS